MYRLLIKQHNVTGLKYLCKSIREDWRTYVGSGVRWLNHLKVHGKNISTTLLFETDDIQLFSWVAEEMSDTFNVVESDEWANLVPETGEGTGAPVGNTYRKGKKNPGAAFWNRVNKTGKPSPVKGRPRPDQAIRMKGNTYGQHWKGKKRPEATARCKGVPRPEASIWMKLRWEKYRQQKAKHKHECCN